MLRGRGIDVGYESPPASLSLASQTATVAIMMCSQRRWLRVPCSKRQTSASSADLAKDF